MYLSIYVYFPTSFVWGSCFSWTSPRKSSFPPAVPLPLWPDLLSSSSPHPYLILTSSSPHPYLILSSSSPHPLLSPRLQRTFLWCSASPPEASPG